MLSYESLWALYTLFSASTLALPQTLSLVDANAIPSNDPFCFLPESQPSAVAGSPDITNATDANPTPWQEYCSIIIHNLKSGKHLDAEYKYTKDPNVGDLPVPFFIQEPRLPDPAKCQFRVNLLSSAVKSDKLSNRDLLNILLSIQWMCIAPGKESDGGFYKGAGFGRALSVTFGKPPLPDVPPGHGPLVWN